MPTFREGDRVRIRLQPDCTDGHPHDASEDGAVRMGLVAPILGRAYHPDELEALDGP